MGAVEVFDKRVGATDPTESSYGNLSLCKHDEALDFIVGAFGTVAGYEGGASRFLASITAIDSRHPHKRLLRCRFPRRVESVCAKIADTRFRRRA